MPINNPLAASRCNAHTKCPPGKYTKTAGTTTSQPECQTCPTGLFKAFTSNSSNTTDFCTKQRMGCPPGKYTKTIKYGKTFKHAGSGSGSGSGMSGDYGYDLKKYEYYEEPYYGESYSSSFPVPRSVSSGSSSSGSIGALYRTTKPHKGTPIDMRLAAAAFPARNHTKPSKSAAMEIRCETCPAGFFTNFTSNSSNATHSCTPHTKCAPGKYTSEAGTATSQPKCNTCAAGFFKRSMSITSTCVATDPTDCSSSIVLFESGGSSSSFRNSWQGWYSAGSTVNFGSGKRKEYNTLVVSRLRFSDKSGRFVEYDLNDGYAGRTLLSIVQGCMGSNRRNTGSSDWKAGLCRNVGTLRSSSASFGRFSVSPTLRIGVGDGGSDSSDWALLMPLQGNANGDFNGNNAWAFGGESQANNGYSGTVSISATCSGRSRFTFPRTHTHIN